jgi:tetratricopeptide (TPR) repeat protein
MDRFRERYKEAKNLLKEAKSAIDSPDLKVNPLELINKSLEIYPDYAEANYYKAFIMNFHHNDFENAKNYLLKAVDNNPFYSKAYYDLAVLLEEHYNDNEGARQYYTLAIQSDSNFDEAYYRLAQILETHYHDYKTA